MPAVSTSTSARKRRSSPVAGRHLARLAIDAAHEKKAIDVTVMDLRGISDEVDYFVICTGETDVQIRAIVESVAEKLKDEAGERPSHREGIPGFPAGFCWITLISWSTCLIQSFVRTTTLNGCGAMRLPSE